MLETSLPDFGSDAYVYRLAPPHVDPETFVTNVADELDLQGDIVMDQPQGRTVYHVFDDDGRSFHWTPETGAFTLAMNESGSGNEMPLDQIVRSAQDWLAGIGYPVDLLAADTQAEPIGDTGWLLIARYAAMPDVGFGHQLGVTVMVNTDGTITEVSGYWLDVKGADSAQLRPADEIWEAVRSGDGLWTGGGIVEGGGEFHVDTMQITYVLTRDASSELVLQPVVETIGDFTSADGQSTARVSCFVQAALTTDGATP
jgi:hypothetical protein